MKSSSVNEELAGNKELTKDFAIQIARVERIFDNTIRKLKLLCHIHYVLKHESEILYKYLHESDANFVMSVCVEDYTRSFSNLSELSSISSTLTNLNMFKKSSIKPGINNRLGTSEENYESHISYVVDIICRNDALVDYLSNLNPPEEDVDPTSGVFIGLVTELKNIIMEKLNVSALDEINYENDLKIAYRSNNLLHENVSEIEEQLEKQREELSKEYDRKHNIMCELLQSIENLKDKTKAEVAQMIIDSETLMMKDYLKSTELQETLAVDAKASTQQYETLLQDHLSEEKNLRAKRFKVETQLSGWIAKYDQDIGEKQAEFEQVEREYNEEEEKFQKLKDEFEEQEDLYISLMREKEEEERRIYEERAFIFLLNRSARKIQRYWREYRARKLARKRGRKSKKGDDKKKKKGKEKKKGETTTIRGGPDPNAIIDSKFGGEIMAELKDADGDPFAKKDITVDLSAD